jgi:F5/8 type C domain
LIELIKGEIMKKTNISVAISAALALSTLAGCSGGSNQSSIGSGTDNPKGDSQFETTYAEIEVNAMKGTLGAVNVTIESLSSTKKFTTQGSTVTDANGVITGLSLVSDPGYSFNGMYRVTVTADDNSTMVCDAPVCGDQVMGEALDGAALGGLTLTTLAWIQSNLGNATDGTPEETVHANALTTMATAYIDARIASGDADLASVGGLEKEQLSASAQIMRVFGLASDVNLFDMKLVSGDNAENFTEVAGVIQTLSLINSTFANFASGKTQAEALAPIMADAVFAAQKADIEISKVLRQQVLDVLAASTVVTALEIAPSDVVDIALPFVQENASAGPVIEFTTAENVAAAIISSSGFNGEPEDHFKAFDNDPDTKWLELEREPAEDNPSYLQIQFAQPKAVRTLAITSANDEDVRDPENFNLQASNDGITWHTLGAWKGASFTERYQTQEFAVNNTLPYAYYRMNITKNKGDVELTQIAEIELMGLITPEVDHTDAEITITSSGRENENETEQEAFDNSPETKWLHTHDDVEGDNPTAEFPAWAQVDFDEPKTVSSIALTSANDSDDRDPENFNIQGSNDGGTTWLTVGEVSGAAFALRAERQVFSFGNLLAFSAYRVNITKNKGDSLLMQVAEIELIGPELPGLNHALTDGAVLSAKAGNGENEDVFKAFDGSADTKWLDPEAISETSEFTWVQVDLPAPATVNTLVLTSANDAEGRDPEDFNLEASMDGVNWIIIGNWKGISFEDRYVRQSFAVTNTLAFSNYRLNITKNKGDTAIVQVAEIEFIGPQYASKNHALADEAIISVSSEHDSSGNETGDKAFDGDYSTKWLANGGAPFSADVTLLDGVIVSELGLTSANDAEGRDPENFDLQGSNDGDTWTTIGAWKGQSFALRGERQVFPMPNGRIFTHYRLNISKNFGDDDLMQIGEIELIGTDVPTP